MRSFELEGLKIKEVVERGSGFAFGDGEIQK